MYGVKFVGDDELPEGHDFVLCRMDSGDMVFFLKESRITERSLEQGWAAFCHVMHAPEPTRLRSA